ncbi:hypothetical protein LCGC14_1605510, partial [marine sediment metagenome]
MARKRKLALDPVITGFETPISNILPNPGGRSDEDQAIRNEAIARREAHNIREQQRVARGTPTTLSGLETPTNKQQASAQAFLFGQGLPFPQLSSLDPVITGFQQPQILTPKGDSSEDSALPPFPALDVSAFQGEDILARLRKEGFTAPVAGQTGGAPQSFEEQQFVLDFLAEFGVKPTDRRLAQEQFDTKTFDPLSTMGKLGFANAEQFRRSQTTGETFGPLRGSDVPTEGSIVITDAEGNPTDRFFNLNRPEARRAIEDGRFIQPIVGELAQTLQGGLPGGEQFYNVPFEQPPIDIGQALSQFGTSDDYLKGLSDFLDEKVFRDRANIDSAFTEIDTIKEEFEAAVQEIVKNNEAGAFERQPGTPPFVELQNPQEMIDRLEAEAQTRIDALRTQIDTEFFTDQSARREFAKARDIIEFDNPPIDQLPFFEDIKASLTAPAIARQEQQLTERFQNIPQPPTTAPPPQEEEVIQQDFLS